MIFTPPIAPPMPADYAELIHREEVPAQGPEAESIRHALESMTAHLLERARDAAIADETELEDYRHVPFKSTGTIRIHYRKGGVLKPRAVWSERLDA